MPFLSCRRRWKSEARWCSTPPVGSRGGRAGPLFGGTSNVQLIPEAWSRCGSPGLHHRADPASKHAAAQDITTLSLTSERNCTIPLCTTVPLFPAFLPPCSPSVSRIAGLRSQFRDTVHPTNNRALLPRLRRLHHRHLPPGLAFPCQRLHDSTFVFSVTTRAGSWAVS